MIGEGAGMHCRRCHGLVVSGIELLQVKEQA
jgi:hypothetical protein